VARAAADVDVDVWHAADFLDSASAERVVRAAEASHLLHLAWTTAHGRYWSDPANLAWARATLHVVELFAERGGVRAVMCGSCAQYDWATSTIGPSGLLHEASTPRRPASLYGAAKQATSDLLVAWSRTVGLSAAVALLFFPYGPFEKQGRLVPSVARHLLAGEAAPISAGTQIRDFIHVADCGAALAALVDSDVSGSVNIGSGRGSSVADVATTIAGILDREELLRIGALPADESGHAAVADVTRLRDELGFVPRYDLGGGLRDAVDFWRLRTS